jgi:hypothetical protein
LGLGSVASLLAATLYQGNHDRNHKFWNIGSTERYLLHMQVLLECSTYKWKVRNGKNEQVPHMEHELLTLPVHLIMSSPPRFLVGFVLLDL